MMAGKFYLRNYANWQISYFILTDSRDAEAILHKLYCLGGNCKFLHKAENLLYSDRLNTGLTYSNTENRHSIIVVSKTTNIWEFLNSFAHEIDHLEKHISRELGFNPYSESASYLVGEIIKGMSYDITRKYYARINRE